MLDSTQRCFCSAYAHSGCLKLKLVMECSRATRFRCLVYHPSKSSSVLITTSCALLPHRRTETTLMWAHNHMLVAKFRAGDSIGSSDVGCRRAAVVRINQVALRSMTQVRQHHNNHLKCRCWASNKQPALQYSLHQQDFMTTDVISCSTRAHREHVGGLRVQQLRLALQVLR